MANVTTDNWKETLGPGLKEYMKEAIGEYFAQASKKKKPTSPLLEELLEELEDDPKVCRKVSAALAKCEQDSCQSTRRQPCGASSAAQPQPLDLNRLVTLYTNFAATWWLNCAFPGLMFSRTLN
jgi:hypothetical protein